MKQKFSARISKSGGEIVFYAKIACRWIFGWWLNALGYMRGTVWCSYCKCSFDWAEHRYTIWYLDKGSDRGSVQRGISPLCDLCFEHLSEEKIMRHVHKRLEIYPDDGITYEEAYRDAAESVHKRKLLLEQDKPIRARV